MLLGLVNDILDFTKIESGQLELAEDTYNLSTLLQDLNLLFKARAGGKPISTKVDIDTNLPSKLYGDDIRIKQVLVNILSKAKLVPSNSEGRRAVEQGGVTVNGEKITDVKKAYTPDEINAADFIVRRGKKSYAKIVIK